MARFNIYFIHSDKFDYNNILYKRLLASSTCLQHNLILPMTKEYQDKYTKDLMNKADLIICEVSHPSWGLWLELKYLSKVEKPKLFLSLDNKIPSKFKKLVPSIRQTNETNYIKTIEDFINENAAQAVDVHKDNTITLGEL